MSFLDSSASPRRRQRGLDPRRMAQQKGRHRRRMLGRATGRRRSGVSHCAHSALPSPTCSAPCPISIYSSSRPGLGGAGAGNYYTSAFLDRLPRRCHPDPCRIPPNCSRPAGPGRAAHPSLRRRDSTSSSWKHRIHRPQLTIPRQLRRPYGRSGGPFAACRLGPGSPKRHGGYGKGEMYVNFASDGGEGSRRASYPPETLRPPPSRQGSIRSPQHIPIQYERFTDQVTEFRNT